MNERNNFPSAESILKGAVAGFIATLPMTIVMLALHRQLPPGERYSLPPWQITRRLLRRTGAKKHVQDEEEENTVALVNHFGFGAAAGALYGLATSMFSIPSIWGGLVFGIIVWASSYLGWLPAARLFPPATEESPRRNLLMIAAHLVWGSILALVIRRLETASGQPDWMRQRTA
jgi:uncharacterized membrane protein YagU involved in acid resistance